MTGVFEMTETETEALRLLRDLVQQIEINDFKDSLGHDAHLLRPYVEAKRFLAAQATPRP
jgi:predicted xylose isomerase-like sugar epimerase